MAEWSAVEKFYRHLYEERKEQQDQFLGTYFNMITMLESDEIERIKVRFGTQQEEGDEHTSLPA